MAKLALADGREVSLVKPHLGDQLELEKQMGMRPSEFAKTMRLVSFQTAFSVWATLRRNGVHAPISEVLEIDLENLGRMVRREPGDADPESEGEETTDPPVSATVEPDDPEPVESGPPGTDSTRRSLRSSDRF